MKYVQMAKKLSKNCEKRAGRAAIGLSAGVRSVEVVPPVGVAVGAAQLVGSFCRMAVPAACFLKVAVVGADGLVAPQDARTCAQTLIEDDGLGVIKGELGTVVDGIVPWQFAGEAVKVLVEQEGAEPVVACGTVGGALRGMFEIGAGGFAFARPQVQQVAEAVRRKEGGKGVGMT